jgi:hypothetical protein
VWPRRKLVRLHLEGNQPSLEGVLVGWPRWHAGHYVLRLAKLIESENLTVTLDGHAVRVPRERVVFCQELRA